MEVSLKKKKESSFCLQLVVVGGVVLCCRAEQSRAGKDDAVLAAIGVSQHY